MSSRGPMRRLGVYSPNRLCDVQRMTDYLYLASQSPRRSRLLDQLGVAHRLLLANADGDVAEDPEAIEAVRAGESPRRYVQRVTDAKLEAAVARRVRRGLAEAPVLCADTTVARGGTIYGKPENLVHACRMLSELAGATHRVLTAVALHADGLTLRAVSESRVTFAAMDAPAIAAYVASGEPLGKAGAYAVQGRAAAFIAHLAGSYSGIMGLPMFETAQLLRMVGMKV